MAEVPHRTVKSFRLDFRDCLSEQVPDLAGQRQQVGIVNCRHGGLGVDG